ncbi:hypothetical protein N7470_006840 [Penicillium chermesinum]|nr:hypothetical protein N7470_006840 [Penicillium chermesinum]
MDQQHLAHWEDTLMGREFWEDAATHEQRPALELQQNQEQGLHTQFPFNQAIEKDTVISTETVPEEDEPTPPAKHRRGVSIPDLPKLRVRTTLRRTSTVTATTSRSELVQRRVQSPASPKTSSTWSPLSSRFPLLGAPKTPKQFSLPESEIPLLSPNKLVPSSSPSPSPRGVRTPGEEQLEGFEQPYFKKFADDRSWEGIPRNVKRLHLDLFIPFTPSAEDDFLAIEEMKPLLGFRQLRSLHISFITNSLQPYIWQAVWANVHLEELELEMAIGPRLDSPCKELWKPIDGSWKMDNRVGGKPRQRRIGRDTPRPRRGEYLDKLAIEKAKIRAVVAGGLTNPRLPIKKLTLNGFIVDADPFLNWFDPQMLRSIHFKANCIDSGFWLPKSMSHVSIRVAKEMDYKPVAAGVIRVDIGRDVKLVDVKPAAAK